MNVSSEYKGLAYLKGDTKWFPKNRITRNIGNSVGDQF